MSKRVLIISTVWPEPTSSAAGVRTLQILEFCKKANYLTRVSSPSHSNSFREALEAQGFQTHEIPANDSRFDELLKEFQPDVVIFDRFLMEEQFGARVWNQVPDAIRLIDTQDLHFLRKSRQATPGQWLEKEVLRELASIFRSDHAWVLSDFEHQLLIDEFQIDPSYVSTMGFSYPEQFQEFKAGRKNFTWIGNFRHPPNYESVFQLVKEIWPEIHRKIPQAELHIYGAYPPEEVMKLDREIPGVRVLGPAEEVTSTLSKYAALLAPLRFGAGIKGKIAESWIAGIPVVTTDIGAEGMRLSNGDFGGLIAQNEIDFVSQAVKLYQSESLQKEIVDLGQKTIREKFSFDIGFFHFFQTVEGVSKIKRRLRGQRWIQKILWREEFRSLDYFSKWIELKNRPSGV